MVQSDFASFIQKAILPVAPSYRAIIDQLAMFAFIHNIMAKGGRQIRLRLYRSAAVQQMVRIGEYACTELICHDTKGIVLGHIRRQAPRASRKFKRIVGRIWVLGLAERRRGARLECSFDTIYSMHAPQVIPDNGRSYSLSKKCACANRRC
jgi:hypothetical protein